MTSTQDIHPLSSPWIHACTADLPIYRTAGSFLDVYPTPEILLQLTSGEIGTSCDRKGCMYCLSGRRRTDKNACPAKHALRSQLVPVSPLVH